MGYGLAVIHGPGVPPGVQVGDPVAVGDGGTVGVGLAHPPPPTTLISTEVVVVLPLYPPTATAVFPTSVPAGNERGTFRAGPLVQLSVAGSYTTSAPVVSGVNSLFSHAPTPLLLEVGEEPAPVKG